MITGRSLPDQLNRSFAGLASRSSRQAEHGIPTEGVRELRYDRASALGSEARIVLDVGSTARAEHLMVDATTRRPEHPPADADGHPGVDAGIHRWMPASRGRDAALQSNSSYPDMMSAASVLH